MPEAGSDSDESNAEKEQLTGLEKDREALRDLSHGLRTLLLQLLAAGVALLGDRELDSATLRERDRGLGALTDDEDVRETGRELAVEDVPDVDDVVATDMTLLVDKGTDTALVTTTSEHDELRAGSGGQSRRLGALGLVPTHVALLELDVVDDLVLDEVELDRVVDLDGRVRVPDGAAVVGNDEGNTLGAELDLLDLEELVGRLLLRDAVDREAALDVVQETEVLARLLNRDDV